MIASLKLIDKKLSDDVVDKLQELITAIEEALDDSEKANEGE
jgi:hypothetical protein